MITSDGTGVDAGTVGAEVVIATTSVDDGAEPAGGGAGEETPGTGTPVGGEPPSWHLGQNVVKLVTRVVETVEVTFVIVLPPDVVVNVIGHVVTVEITISVVITSDSVGVVLVPGTSVLEGELAGTAAVELDGGGDAGIDVKLAGFSDGSSPGGVSVTGLMAVETGTMLVTTWVELVGQLVTSGAQEVIVMSEVLKSVLVVMRVVVDAPGTVVLSALDEAGVSVAATLVELSSLVVEATGVVEFSTWVEEAAEVVVLTKEDVVAGVVLVDDETGVVDTTLLVVLLTTLLVELAVGTGVLAD